MDDNNNIEDFFENSLGDFNEEPSNKVWDGVEKKLDNSKNNWNQKILKILLAILFAALLLMIINRNQVGQKLKDRNESLSFLYEKIESQEEINGKLKQEIIKIKNELEIVNTSSKSCLTENESLKKKNARASIKFSNQNSDFFRSNLNQAEQNIFQKYNSELGATFENQKNLTNQREGTTEELESINYEKASKTNNLRIEKLAKSEHHLQEIFYERSKDQLSINKLLKFQESPLGSNNLASTKKYSSNLKYGVTAAIIGTGTDVSSGLDPGFSLGLEMEMQLYKPLWLTLDMRYNRNSYVMEFLGNNPVQESDFPTPRSLNTSYNQVSVKNTYFDFPIGLSYNLNLGKNNSVFFNPGVSWQFYLPQEYIYNTIEDERYLYSEERYLVYFGSAFLNIGIERKLSQNNIFQLGFWAEKGLSDFGLEKRSIMNYGLKASLLFSK